MSRSELLDLPEVLQVDPRLLVASRKSIVIKKGAANNTITRQTASSFSNAQVIFQPVLNSSTNTIIDPYMYVETTYNVVISATGLSAPNTVENYLNDYVSYRQYPFNSIISTASVQINNQSITSNPSQFIHALSTTQDFIDNDAFAQSITPIYGDQSQQYSDLVGSIKSPLLSYQSGGEHYSEPRGVFNALWNTTSSGTGTWAFNCTTREPVYNGMLHQNPHTNREGLAYVNLMNITLNFVGNISRIFSVDLTTCPGVTSVAVNVTGSTLVMSQLTVPLLQKLPPRVLRSFNTLICNQTQQQPVTSGTSVVIQSQNINVNQIPKKIYVYVANGATDVPTGYGLTDTFFSIQQVSILFNGKSSLMANFSPSDLYNSCMAEEGSRISFVSSQEFFGTVLTIDPVKLLGLLDNQSSGLIGVFQLQVQATITNIASTTITPTMWVTVANDTILDVDSSGTANLIQGFITEEEIASISDRPAIPAQFRNEDPLGGKTFLDTLKDIFGKAHDFIKGNKFISHGLKFIPHPVAHTLSGIADTFGYQDPRQYAGRRTSRRQLTQYANSMYH